MSFSIARNGMQGQSSSLLPSSRRLPRSRANPPALHSDLEASLDRMTFPPVPETIHDTESDKSLTTQRPALAHRQKQIRVLLSIRGTPRLPPHKVCPRLFHPLPFIRALGTTKLLASGSYTARRVLLARTH
jgi:hypothetical protein